MNYDQFTIHVINYAACVLSNTEQFTRSLLVLRYVHMYACVYEWWRNSIPQHIRTRIARAYNHIVTLRSFSADHSLISVEYTKKETIAVP